MKLNYISCILALLVLASPCAIAQSREQQILKSIGYEDIRIVVDGDDTYVSLSDNVHRGVLTGVQRALDSLRVVAPEQNIHMLICEDGVAQLSLTATKGDGGVKVSRETSSLESRFKGVKRENRSFGRVDLMLYPELFLENSWLDKLYGYAVNFSPAVELTLWPGAKGTAQIIIPLYTNMKDEKQYVRPGVITFRQDVKLYNGIYASASVGNFTNDRIGLDATLSYYSNNGLWGVGGRFGLTGSSTFYGGEWVVSSWRRKTWSAWASYYIPKYNVELKGGVTQKIYGDRGFEGSITRYFKNCAISIYGMSTAYRSENIEQTNGGFSASIPLPGKSRPRRNCGARVTYPEYFVRTYKALNGLDNLTGFSYETTPDAGTLRNFYNPRYVESYIGEL